ncbi:hypothetical protein DPMN_082564 [Dreissena polymorpha]|uniref:Uncharacterized protein n=1 Tax=Dreissena polymorpha TaxID=45954 RepID=A0A9D4BIY4_DREPO|nr:hypothetical protein DPMN_082564 [Dreissena polymorpha]
MEVSLLVTELQLVTLMNTSFLTIIETPWRCLKSYPPKHSFCTTVVDLPACMECSYVPCSYGCSKCCQRTSSSSKLVVSTLGTSSEVNSRHYYAPD